MKTLILVFAILAMTSCATMRKLGEQVCSSQESISAQITEAGGWLGGPGTMIAAGANIILSTGCKLFDVAISSPADLTDDLGITGDETPTPPPAGDDG